ncbi:MAG: TIGR03905 family TSCPD domain-containing protein [Peptococcaceae bacterium]|jgi:uncharacterized protein (TIGR03905 family)|nr:TIGR03905 family TSCPD domain-containing protein [Peptococcaceae bacterium]
MRYEFIPTGVCSRKIIADVDGEGIIRGVTFEAGCNGNGIGVGRLVQGRSADEIIALLRGVQCGQKGTSCPDQLAKMLEGIQAGRIKGQE